MSWVQIGLQDVIDRMTVRERNALQQTTSNTGGLPGVVGPVITYVTDLVRGKVARNKDNRPYMGPAGTIPSEVYIPALDLCRYQVAQAVPDSKELVESLRSTVYKDANDRLKEAADGDIVILPYGQTTYQADQAQVGGSQRFHWLDAWGNRQGPQVPLPGPTQPNLDDFQAP